MAKHEEYFSHIFPLPTALPNPCRHRSLSSESFATITWIIPNGTTPGRYRIGHQGDYKHVFGWTHRFSGYSTEFDVAGEGRGDERQAPSSIFSTLRQWCAKAMAAIF